MESFPLVTSKKVNKHSVCTLWSIIKIHDYILTDKTSAKRPQLHSWSSLRGCATTTQLQVNKQFEKMWHLKVQCVEFSDI